MNIREIENLLEKYYEGQTTLEEEQTLQRYLSGNEASESLKKSHPLFLYSKLARTDTVSDPNFDRKLNDRLAVPGKTVRMAPWHSTGNKFLFIGSLVAAVLLLVGLYFSFQHEIFKNKFHERHLSAPETAFDDARQALLLVSVNFNTGLKQVERLHYFDKALHNAALFNKFYQYQTIIINPDLSNQQSIKSTKP